MDANELRNFAWVVVQAEGNSLRSSASQVWRQNFGQPFNVDALKRAVKAEHAQKLQHVDAADLEVYANDQELTRMSGLVAELLAGGDEDDPLIVQFRPPTESVGAAATRFGAEAGSLEEMIMSNFNSLRLDLHTIKADQPKRRYLTPTAASGPAKEKYDDVLDGLQIRVETKNKPQSPGTRPIHLARLNFSWSLAQVAEEPESVAQGEKRGQTVADLGESTDTQDTVSPPEESFSASPVHHLETDKKLERTAYQPVLEFVSQLFPELNLQIVAEGKNLTSGNLFSVEAFTARRENPGQHGQLVTFITTIEGRSDIAAFAKNGTPTRRGVVFVIEIKTPRFNKASGCREAITQLLGLNIDNPLHSPPVLLTNLVNIHSVFFVAPLDQFPFYQIQEEQFHWFESALERVGELCVDHRRTHHFGRGPSPDVLQDGSSH